MSRRDDASVWAMVSAALAVGCARVHLVGFLYVLVATALALALVPVTSSQTAEEEAAAVSSRRAMTANPRKSREETRAPTTSRKRINGTWALPRTAEEHALYMKAVAREYGLL